MHGCVHIEQKKIRVEPMQIIGGEAWSDADVGSLGGEPSLQRANKKKTKKDG